MSKEKMAERAQAWSTRSALRQPSALTVAHSSGFRPKGSHIMSRGAAGPCKQIDPQTGAVIEEIPRRGSRKHQRRQDHES